jgi:hypothetical protein
MALFIILYTPQMHKHPHPVHILQLGHKHDGTVSQTHYIMGLFHAVQTTPSAPSLVVQDQFSPRQEFIYCLLGGQDSLILVHSISHPPFFLHNLAWAENILDLICVGLQAIDGRLPSLPFCQVSPCILHQVRCLR